MTISLKHAFTSALLDGSDATLVRPSNWNAEHTLTQAAGTVLGRAGTAAGATGEIPMWHYATVALAAAVAIPVACESVYTATFNSTTKKGGAWYKRVAAEPSHALKFQDALSAWWELDEPYPNVFMAGAAGDGVTNDTTAFTRIAAYARLVLVPYMSTGYSVANTVAAGNCTFIIVGSFTSQIVGTASEADLNVFIYNAGLLEVQQLRVEPEHNTMTAANEANRRIAYFNMAEPLITEKTITLVEILSGTSVRITATAHGYSSSNTVFLRDIGGTVELNNTIHTITVVDSARFTITVADTTGWGAYTTGGKAILSGTGPFTSFEGDFTWTGYRNGSGGTGGVNAGMIRAMQIQLSLQDGHWIKNGARAIGASVIDADDNESPGDVVGMGAGVNSRSDNTVAATGLSAGAKFYGGSFSAGVEAATSGARGSPIELCIGAEFNISNDVAGELDRGFGIHLWSNALELPNDHYAAVSVGISGSGLIEPWQEGLFLSTGKDHDKTPLGSTSKVFFADHLSSAAWTVSDIFDCTYLTATNYILKHANINITGAGDVVMKSGQGIDFAANTASAVSGVTVSTEKLIHHEEGTWTPFVTDAAANTGATHSVQEGTYQRTGNRVFFEGRVTVTALNAVVSTIQIGGLPFNFAGANRRPAVTIGEAAGLAITANQVVGAYLSPSADQIILRLWDATTGQTSLTAAEFSNTGDISFSGHYSLT